MSTGITKRRRSKKVLEETVSFAEAEPSKPVPPNIFLYVQLAKIKNLPDTTHPLEIHLKQGDSPIIKCDEHYNTEACIMQSEFLSKPTYTLLFQQDNLDRINHAVDNPLLILLYMRKSEPTAMAEELEEETENTSSKAPKSSDQSNSLNSIEKEEVEALNYFEENETLMLLGAGYIDVAKLFGHKRIMIHEHLYLYPLENVPNELRTTVQTEWHLYTLLPIAKQLTFTNLAFVTFESIYNLPEEINYNVEQLEVELTFRSRLPNERNEYEELPWCSFTRLVKDGIANQNKYQIFESFRNKSLTLNECNAPGLQTAMAVELHNIFTHLLCTEGIKVDYQFIDVNSDEALVCNSFHRYLMTQKDMNILYNAICLRLYVVGVTLWEASEKRRKLFVGTLDPSVLIYPTIQMMRFAVALKYVGPRAKSKTAMINSLNASNARENGAKEAAQLPTFAIIKICLFGHVGEVFDELKQFRESYINQNRLLFCGAPFKNPPTAALEELRGEAYARFDKLIRDTIGYIVSRNVNSLKDQQKHFCCTVRNLTNALMKVVGSDFNVRVPTSTNVEFANLCATAFNELEQRVHKIFEDAEDEYFEQVTNLNDQKNYIIDHFTTFKLMSAAGDERMATFLIEKIKKEKGKSDMFEFYNLISNMERGDYVAAKSYFDTKKSLPSEMQEYFVGWIKIYLVYVETRDNPETSANATECLLKSITEYSEMNYNRIHGWILLYCFYRKFNYAPGFEYARFRYECYYSDMESKFSSAPFSLQSIMLNYYPEFNDQLGELFFDVCKIFFRLGLYEFGGIVFSHVQHLCSEADRYLVNSTLNILLDQLDENFALRTFTFDDSEKGKKMSYFNDQANGNIEYYRGNMSNAKSYYLNTLNYEPIENARNDFHLSILRLAYISFETEDYEHAIEALNRTFLGKLLPMTVSYTIGKGYYKLYDLDNALEAFAYSTTFNYHLPDAWGFLALINLRTGHNYNALECWKYAKLDPTYTLHDDIYEGLAEIDFDSVEMFVDRPEKKIPM